jgi:ankyrin repeat protein
MSEALQALFRGDVAKAQELLGPDAELSLFDAAAFGRLERIDAILRDDPSQVSALSEDGFTALHLAIFAAQEDAVHLLIERGADVDVRSEGSIARVPPLGTAAFVGSVPVARLLLENGADVDGQGEGGFTALHAAAQNGDESFVRLLLEHGADPSIATAQGQRPADLATDGTIRALLGP